MFSRRGTRLRMAASRSLVCGAAFANLDELLADAKLLATMKTSEEARLARMLRAKTSVVRGLAINSRFCLKAVHWLISQNIELNHRAFQNIVRAFRNAIPEGTPDERERWEIHSGAWWILRKVHDWPKSRQR